MDSVPHMRRPWKLRRRTLDGGPLPLLMGIVNVTPDSFSDGGRFFDPAAAVEEALRLVAAGADLLDIGGESTRPGAEPVAADEELGRVMPVLVALAEKAAVPLSIDTTKACVAREALAAGAEVINDISGLTADPAMVGLAVETGCGICAMHMQGAPRTMQQQPVYGDVVQEVFDYLQARRDALIAARIDPARIALDPGIGFGKNLEHNLALLRSIARFRDLGCPLLIGPSRKAFIGKVLDDEPGVAGASSPFFSSRTAGTIGVALALARQNVEILRVHDVVAVRHALQLFAAAGGLAD